MKVRFFLAACVAVMLTGCSLEQSSESSDDPRNGSDGGSDGGSAQATVAGPSWSEYMPVREGRVCEYSSDGGSGVTDEISLTQRYTDVREESDGTHFTLESTTEISTAADEQYSEAEPLYSETESLEYVLGDDGLLRSEPQLFNQGGFEADVDGFVVYPNIEEVREGKSVSSSMTASVSSSDPSIKAQIEDALEPGERELEVRMDYKVLGVPPEEISTPAGAFTDVVGASFTVEDIEFLNANEETRRDVDDMAESLTDMTGTPTVWYARDTGAVQTGIEGGMASMMGGASSMKLEGCDGEQPESPPADDDAPEEFESPEPTSPENDGNPDPSGGVEATLEQEVGDYYRAAGAEEWAYTYDHLASETRSMFTEGEWFRKNQWLWDREPLIYHINSIGSDGSSSAEVELKITAEDDSSWTETAYFVSEDGEWRHQFSEAEIALFMPGVPFDEFVEAQGGGVSDGDTSGVCAGVAGCEIVDTADVDGDGSLDEIAIVGEPDEYSGGTEWVTVRVLLADGTTLAREVEVEGWYRDTAWHGATDFGQVPGEELVLGGTSGPHTLWFQVLTYRNGELAELPYPDAAPGGESFYATMWPIDSALSAYVGVECRSDAVVLRSVTSVGPGGEGGFEGEETRWVLEGDAWQMVESSPLEYPDANRAFGIAGWFCGDLPRGYD